MTAVFDALDASGVFLGSAERHGRSVVVVDHLLELGLPVANELGHVRPDLGRLPALGAAFIGIGQTVWRRPLGMLCQPLLDEFEPLHHIGRIHRRTLPAGNVSLD